MFVGNHISLRIKVDDSFHHSGLWHISGEYEHAEGASIVWLPDGLRTGGDRTPHGPVESLLTGLHPDELGAIVNLDVRVVLGLLCHHGIAGEVVLTHQQRHLACEAGENTDSSAAAKPPPTTMTSLPVKNSPSQVAQ